MKLFQVYEGKNIIFETKNFAYAIHELLSIVKYRSELIIKNGLSLNNLIINDLYVCESIPQKKRYKFVTNFYEYSKENNRIINKNKKTVNLKCSICRELLKKINDIEVTNANEKVSTKTGSSFEDLTVIYDDSTMSSDENDKSNLTEKINKVTELKKKAEETLSSCKTQIEEENKNLTDEISELNFQKKKQEIQKEKDLESKKKFKVDKITYFLLKNDVENGKMKKKDIPDTFTKEKYEIFEKLDSMNVLTVDLDVYNDQVNNDYYEYLNLFKTKLIHNNCDLLIDLDKDISYDGANFSYFKDLSDLTDFPDNEVPESFN